MLTNVKYRVCIIIHLYPRFCIFIQKLFFARIFFSVSSAYAHAALAFSPHLHLIIYMAVLAPIRVLALMVFSYFFFSEAIFLSKLHLLCAKNSKFAIVII